MAFEEIINYLYFVVGILLFSWGFSLVYSALKKVNKIERESFDWKDYITCIIFGLMFSLSILFAINVSVDFSGIVSKPSFAGQLLTVLIVILILFPLYDMINLAKPTSDSVTDFHKGLESKFVDKAKGGWAYIIAFLLFVVIYLVPIIGVTYGFSLDLVQVSFIWFLLFPLFFLNMYAASGQIANIVKTLYISKLVKGNATVTKFTGPLGSVISLVKIMIALIPFLLCFYSIISPVMNAINGGGFSEKNDISALISLFTTVVFGIQGFFTRFWNKKSKTKAIDFYFSGYIMIAICINMLINFISIKREIVTNIFGVELFGIQPLLGLSDLVSDYAILVPIIVLQSTITVIYGIVVFFDKNSEFQANVRLGAVNSAYSLPTEVEILKLRRKEEQYVQKKKDVPASLTLKLKKPNYMTLLKSVILDPGFNKFGVDVNEDIRIKAGHLLYLLTEQDKTHINEIVEFLLNETIRKEGSGNKGFLSKQAFDALGKIGINYPDLVLSELVNALPKADMMKKRYILDALGDIGEKEENTLKIIEQDTIDLILKGKSFEVRNAAIISIVEMGMGLSDLSKILEKLYKILDEGQMNAKKHLNGPFDSSNIEDFLIETTLTSILKLSSKDPGQINIEKILPFLNYQGSSGDTDTQNYILYYALKILAFLVYYYPKKIPLDQIKKFASDSRNYIRYIAIDLLGNFALSQNEESLVGMILEQSLKDTDADVRAMCNESVVEYYTAQHKESINIAGKSINISDFYFDALKSTDKFTAENASEALKSVAPLFNHNVVSKLEEKIAGENQELVRDCSHTMGYLTAEQQKQINLQLLYDRLENGEDRTKSELLWTLGMIAKTRTDIDVVRVAKYMEYATDPEVRFNAIFAIGKIGKNQPEECMKAILHRLEEIDQKIESQELELLLEGLGVIGKETPLYQVIASIQQALMGDINPFCKDVAARALYDVGRGMISRGETEEDLVKEKERMIKNKYPINTKEVKLGNIMMMLVEALQQKAIPDSVIDIISDSLQDLLPYFLYLENGAHQFDYLNTLQSLLMQAYNSNYSHEILETIDRVSSLKAFRLYVDEDKHDNIRQQSKQLALEYTPDGKQFFDQGMLFKELNLPKQDELALRSYELAVELDPNEYFSPSCYLEMGKIYLKQNNKQKATIYLKLASQIFAFFDEIEEFKECETYLSQLK